MYTKNIQTIDIDIGLNDQEYVIDPITIQNIENIYNEYTQENQSIHLLNKKTNETILKCIELLTEKETDIATLRAISDLNFSVLMLKVNLKLKEKGLWKIQKRQLNGKTYYRLSPT